MRMIGQVQQIPSAPGGMVDSIAVPIQQVSIVTGWSFGDVASVLTVIDECAVEKACARTVIYAAHDEARMGGKGVEEEEGEEGGKEVHGQYLRGGNEGGVWSCG
jgi:hypothetical protein